MLFGSFLNYAGEFEFRVLQEFMQLKIKFKEIHVSFDFFHSYYYAEKNNLQ